MAQKPSIYPSEKSNSPAIRGDSAPSATHRTPTCPTISADQFCAVRNDGDISPKNATNAAIITKRPNLEKKFHVLY